MKSALWMQVAFYDRVYFIKIRLYYRQMTGRKGKVHISSILGENFGFPWRIEPLL